MHSSQQPPQRARRTTAKLQHCNVLRGAVNAEKGRVIAEKAAGKKTGFRYLNTAFEAGNENG
jgi:hypothetical protein